MLKVFGSYHGHHDTVMVSIGVAYDRIGDRDDLASLPYGAGIPDAVVGLTVVVPFNDADAMERRIERLAAEGRLPACLIMEAAMMNLGVVLPEPGYLEAVRELTARHGIVLIFDEVKTGLTVAAGGAVEHFGVVPDMVTLAKTLGAGLPSGAIGGTGGGDGLRRGRARLPGRHVQRQPADDGRGAREPVRGAHAGGLRAPPPSERPAARGVRRASSSEYRLPGYAVGIGAKGCVTFSPVRVVDYETFKAHQDVELTELGWLWNMNRGIFATPGREEEWTISVQHTDEAVDRYVAVFEELARELTGSRDNASGSDSGSFRIAGRGPVGDPGGMSEHTVEGPAVKRLERSRDDRMLAGVCGGLARYFGIHPAFYRVGFVVLTLIGGAGILDLPRGRARHPGRGQGRLDRRREPSATAATGRGR